MELLSYGGVTQEEKEFSTLFKSWLIALPTLLRSVRSFDKSSKAASRVNRLYEECNSREVFWIVCRSEEVKILLKKRPIVLPVLTISPGPKTI
jgi:hypothetical protein